MSSKTCTWWLTKKFNFHLWNSITTYLKKPKGALHGSCLAHGCHTWPPWCCPTFKIKHLYCNCLGSPAGRYGPKMGSPVILYQWGRFRFFCRRDTNYNLITIYIQTHGDKTRVSGMGNGCWFLVERSWCKESRINRLTSIHMAHTSQFFLCACLMSGAPKGWWSFTMQYTDFLAQGSLRAFLTFTWALWQCYLGGWHSPCKFRPRL